MAASSDVPSDSVTVECTAPVNIAVIKYWGKRDTKLILPVNSSLSGTINQGCMCSRTRITASKEFERDTMSLNGSEEDMSSSKRLQAVLSAVRERAGDYVVDGQTIVRKEEWPQYRVRITSNNNFPTAAGLASSASGFACLTRALAELYAVKEAFEGELTLIARQGSGSACRSLHGGFVKWNMGEREDGLDSIAQQVAPETHWPEMRVLILVVNQARKHVSSTSGMQTSVETSPLMAYRAKEVVPRRMAEMEEAILNRDFETFGRLTMQDSNQFHACCLDTSPPIFYMNDTSRRIISMVEAVNKLVGRTVAAYTFDAGPNAVVYLLKADLGPFFQLFMHYFDNGNDGFVTDPLNLAPPVEPVSPSATRYIECVGERNPQLDSVSRIIVSSLGPGATVVDKSHTFQPRSAV